MKNAGSNREQYIGMYVLSKHVAAVISRDGTGVKIGR